MLKFFVPALALVVAALSVANALPSIIPSTRPVARRPPAYWCTWQAQARLFYSTAGASLSEAQADAFWMNWRTNHSSPQWRDFQTEEIIFANRTLPGAKEPLPGMAWLWPRVRSDLVLMLDDSWAMGRHCCTLDPKRYPSYAVAGDDVKSLQVRRRWWCWWCCCCCCCCC